jgi:hypothetical protein
MQRGAIAGQTIAANPSERRLSNLSTTLMLASHLAGDSGTQKRLGGRQDD